MSFDPDGTVALPNCPCCNSVARKRVFSQTLMGKHSVAYYSCTQCNLLQTQPPHWLTEAYTNPVSGTDTGILVRNLANARLLNLLLQTALRGSDRCVDIAGGYGLLTRILRDRGFNCLHSEPYCANLFAQGLEAEAGSPADVIMAFEVLEHLADPYEFLQRSFRERQTRTLVFSTLSFSGDQPPPPGWWYYSVESGQHITFYHQKSLTALAGRLGCAYIRLDEASHIFTDRAFPAWSLAVLRRARLRRWAEALAWLRQTRPSLTWKDHLDAQRQLESPNSASSRSH